MSCLQPKEKFRSDPRFIKDFGFENVCKEMPEVDSLSDVFLILTVQSCSDNLTRLSKSTFELHANVELDHQSPKCSVYFPQSELHRNQSSLQDIQLSGSHIRSEHCTFQNTEGVVSLVPSQDALCYVNGRQISGPTVLNTGSRVILGKNHVFRFNHPDQGKDQIGVILNFISLC